ncbi:MAG: rhomboid family intramembrane serine protease [Solirubrobacteraceae bacterium]
MIPLKDRNPTASFPAVTLALIAANVGMYFLFQHGTLSLGDPSSRAYLCNLGEYAAVPRELTHAGFELGSCGGQPPSHWITPFTAMFMHGGLLHLGGNMLFLWVFGNNVEDAMGRVKFLAFYILGGLAALALQVLVEPSSAVPTIGASGAVAGVLGGYILLFPRARVWTFVWIVVLPIPALVVLGFWFLQQVAFGYFGLTDPTVGVGTGGGVAYFAHIGGFVFGLATVRAWVARRRPVEPARFGGLS